ncbi:hypothetical protein D3C85_1478010 [compost metagenome]
MVGIVEADANHIRDLAYAGAEPCIGRHGGQARRIEGAQPCKALGRKCGPVNVAHDGRQIAQDALCINEAGFFRATGAESNETHGESFWLLRI